MKTRFVLKLHSLTGGVLKLKTFFFAAIVLLQLAALHLTAQKTRTYCWITFKNSNVEWKGELIGLTDTSVCVHFFPDKDQPDFSPTIQVSMIGQVRCDIKKKTGKSLVGKGILIGLGLGLVTGVIVGSTYTSNPTNNSGTNLPNNVGNTAGNVIGDVQTGMDITGSIILGTLFGGFGGAVIGAISHGWAIKSQYDLQIEDKIKTYQQNIEKFKIYVVPNKQKP